MSSVHVRDDIGQMSFPAQEIRRPISTVLRYAPAKWDCFATRPHGHDHEPVLQSPYISPPESAFAVDQARASQSLANNNIMELSASLHRSLPVVHLELLI